MSNDIKDDNVEKVRKKPGPKKGQRYNYKNPILKTNINGTAGQSRLFDNVNSMDILIEDYFDTITQCPEEVGVNKYGDPVYREKPALWLGLVLHLGFAGLTSIEPYVNGNYDDSYNNFSEVLTRAKNKCLVHKLEGSMMGKFEPKSVALAASAFHAVNLTTKREDTHILESNRPKTEQEIQLEIEEKRQQLLEMQQGK